MFHQIIIPPVLRGGEGGCSIMFHQIIIPPVLRGGEGGCFALTRLVSETYPSPPLAERLATGVLHIDPTRILQLSQRPAIAMFPPTAMR